MLSNQQIENNKQEFLNLVNQISIPGANIQGLLNWLEQTDFFTAPASTIYHNNFEGGLCDHTLNVYRSLVDLVNINNVNIPRDSILVVSLFHDLSKVNFYESFVVNKKKYYEGGTKKDNLGKFDWYSEEAYKVKDVKDRFIAGEHGENSVYLLNQFIPLDFQEVMAIRHHHMGLGESKTLGDLSAIANKYPLIPLLHAADLLATFIKERLTEETKCVQNKF